jgi:hypothetical protein
VGHGTIRLLGRANAAVAHAAPADAAPDEPQPVGHGTIRLLETPPPAVHTDPVTAAAVADILAAVASS